MAGGASISEVVAAALGEPVVELRAVSGGDINDAYRATLGDGRRLFVKTSPRAPDGGFTTEAAGLRWLTAATSAGGPRLPQVLGTLDGDSDPRMLILEWIEQGRLGLAGEEALGHQLAALHRAGAPNHGAPPPGSDELIIGPLRLPSTADPTCTWPAAYGQLRLLPVARLADRRGGLPAGGLASVERVAGRLADLVGDDEPPARLHGDLWGGNVMAGVDGLPYLIDPAAYGGHREVDLAMLRLFGGVGARCFAAYDEAYPLSAGHQDRVKLYQLFPLLVHAALFGGGYGARAIEVARHYVG